MPPKRALLALLAAIAPATAAADPAVADPPRWEAALQTDAAGGAQLTDGADHPAGRQQDAHAVFSFTRREPVSAGAWYFDWGAQDEVYAFRNGGAFPIGRLQDFAANLGLEYYVKGEPAASLTVSPGVYFQNSPGHGSWDAPVQLEGGVPIAGSLSGVLGGMDGRLYREPIPIAGLVWQVGPGVRLEAVYPEPSLSVACGPGLELRLAGELGGGAFETDPIPARTPVEFSSYRVGLSIRSKLGGGFELTAGAGVEVEREFDFYRQGRRIDAGGAPYFELGLKTEH